MMTKELYKWPIYHFLVLFFLNQATLIFILDYITILAGKHLQLQKSLQNRNRLHRKQCKEEKRQG